MLTSNEGQRRSADQVSQRKQSPGRRFARRTWLAAALGGASLAATAWWSRRSGEESVTTPVLVALHASSACQCCHLWARRMEEAGFRIETTFAQDIGAVKREFGVPTALQSCHTALVEGYVVEGHVPASALVRLLTERPSVKGLAVPGMPGGSPGMESAPAEPFDVIAFTTEGATHVFA